jgi:hypothetical protein
MYSCFFKCCAKALSVGYIQCERLKTVESVALVTADTAAVYAAF